MKINLQSDRAIKPLESDCVLQSKCNPPMISQLIYFLLWPSKCRLNYAAKTGHLFIIVRTDDGLTLLTQKTPTTTYLTNETVLIH